MSENPLDKIICKKQYTDPHGEERKRNKTAVKLKQVQYIVHFTVVLITAVLFLFLSSPWVSVYSFCIVYFDFN